MKTTISLENCLSEQPKYASPVFDHISFIENQLLDWPEASERYKSLGHTQRRIMALGHFKAAVQHNPARMASTAAGVTADGKAPARPCFLCPSARPRQQTAFQILPGWQLLVNPFPVFPVHFTIAADTHTPQDRMPFDMPALAEALPGFTIFFNGARAGASAPDHMHCQAVLTQELPLMEFVSTMHPATRHGIESSTQWGCDLPFDFWSAVIAPGPKGLADMRSLFATRGLDAVTANPDPALLNAYWWKDATGYMRAVVVPRSAHRPDCYYACGEQQCLVSPGALEMAGIIVTPRQEDFEKLSPGMLRDIYRQTAISGI